jgi:hypothetical protein
MTSFTQDVLSVDAAQAFQAQIPFTFRAGRVRMEPGRYQVWVDPRPSVPMVRLHNVDARETLLLMARTAQAASEAGGQKLRFQCGALASLCVGECREAYTFQTPASGRQEGTRATEIELTPVKAD